MSTMPSAMESIPDMQPAPPDAQSMTLQDHLDGALALIAQDRMLTPDEMSAVSNFLQAVQMVAAGKAAGPGGAPTNPMGAAVNAKMQQGGFGTPQPRQESPYGQSTNPNVSYGGQ